MDTELTQRMIRRNLRHNPSSIKASKPNTGTAENINPTVTKTIGRITIIISIITWCMFLGWIMSNEMDGLGARQDHLTASYFKLRSKIYSPHAK